ncbi:glycosyltransferase family 4 protein [bacterium]|nr:glycosyltransferase family 4 protein [bacterium]
MTIGRATPQVVMLAPGEVFGGVETQLLGLCESLRGRGGPAPVIALFHDRELAARAREVGLDVVVIRARHRYDPAAARDLCGLVDRAGADVLHVHGYRAAVTAAVAGSRLGVPVVKTEHGLPEPGGGPLVRLKTALNRRLDGWATRRIGAAVCYVTADIMERCRGVHRGLERRVVHNGIAPLDPAATSRPAELAAGACEVGLVGRVSAVKGLDHALRAMASDSMPAHVRLHVIGSGPLERSLSFAARDLGLADRVLFHGFRRNVYDWLAHLDVLLMPSLHEGLPYTLLEAMSLGAAVVASRVGGLAEVLEDGRTGLLVEVGDEAGIAAAVARLAADPQLRASLGGAAAREQRARYTLETMTEAYLGIYGASIG